MAFRTFRRTGSGAREAPRSASLSQSRRDAFWLVVISLLVGVVVAWVHSPVLACTALSFDDNDYLTSNPLVTAPGWDSAGRFFGEVLEPSTVRGYYQPLAMVSLMLDYAAGGRSDHLRPFHVTGLMLHALNAALVVVLIYQLAGSVCAAALVGLLFGLHPTATEVIPWIAQRKTLLATVFSLGCLISYVRWSHARRYGALVVSLALYVLALLSKPTAVPLVAVLIALDWWPLDQIGRRAWIEKIPYTVIGGVFAIITLISQARVGGTFSAAAESAWRPLLIVSYNVSFYLRQLLWPVGWPGYYVFPEPFSLSQTSVLAYSLVSLGLGAFVFASVRWTRALAFGAGAYVALLAPTLGVIGFTEVVAANRFLYLPMIAVLIPLGCAIGMIWKDGGARTRVTPARALVLTLATFLCVGEAFASRAALVPWRDTVSLCAHLAAGAPTAPKVRYNYGNALSDVGRTADAVREYEAAVALRPEYDQAHNNLAVELDALDRTSEAIRHFEIAIAVNPQNARARNSFGVVLLRRGHPDQAIVQFREASRIAPAFADAHFNLGVALTERNDWSAAAQSFQAAIRLAPGDADAQARLGYVYERLGRLDDAVAHYRQALAIDPAHTIAAERLKRLAPAEAP